MASILCHIDMSCLRELGLIINNLDANKGEGVIKLNLQYFQLNLSLK